VVRAGAYGSIGRGDLGHYGGAVGLGCGSGVPIGGRDPAEIVAIGGVHVTGDLGAIHAGELLAGPTAATEG
jgi:hypothetical protein